MKHCITIFTTNAFFKLAKHKIGKFMLYTENISKIYKGLFGGIFEKLEFLIGNEKHKFTVILSRNLTKRFFFFSIKK